jgi:hypothetical protein
MTKQLATTPADTRAMQISNGSRLSAIVEAAYLQELATRPAAGDCPEAR